MALNESENYINLKRLFSLFYYCIRNSFMVWFVYSFMVWFVFGFLLRQALVS